jgi:uncharacterized protein (TIGR02266 family)
VLAAAAGFRRGVEGMATATLTEQVETPQGLIERPVRVDIPVLVSFSSESFAVHDFTLNLSEGGIFIPTDKMCPVGTRGTLKFRSSQYEDPMIVIAEVVRTVEPDEEQPAKQCGLGLKFLEVSDAQLKKLREMVEGVRSGTVVETIRKSLMESTRTLAQELRSRPTDQKMMLALNANSKEIDALVRDATPSVLLRLLENPRLTHGHVVTMLRSPKLTTRVLSTIKAKGRFLTSAEARFLFCTHLNTNLGEAMEQLRLLPTERLRKVFAHPQVKSQIRVRAQELTRPRGGPGVRRR